MAADSGEPPSGSAPGSVRRSLLVGDRGSGRNALDEDLAADEGDLVAGRVVEACQGGVRGLLPGARYGLAFLEDDRVARADVGDVDSLNACGGLEVVVGD